MTKLPEVQGTGAGFYAAVTTETAKTLRYSVPFRRNVAWLLWVLCRKQNQSLWGIYCGMEKLVSRQPHELKVVGAEPTFAPNIAVYQHFKRHKGFTPTGMV